MCGCAVVEMAVILMDSSHTWTSSILLSSALVLGLLRLGLRHLFTSRHRGHQSQVRAWMLEHDGLFSVVSFILVVVGGFAAERPSVLGAHSYYFIVVVSGAVHEEMTRYTAGVLFSCLAACVGVGAACLAYFYEGSPYLFGHLGVMFAYGLVTLVADRQRRSHFEAVMLAQVFQDRAQFAVEAYHALLEMLIPPPLIPAVKQKVNRVGTGAASPDLVQWLGDICVCTMWLSPLRVSEEISVGCSSRKTDVPNSFATSSTLISPIMTMGGSSRSEHFRSGRSTVAMTTFRRLEAAIDCLEHAIGIRGDGLLYKVSTIGDAVTVAGPIIDKNAQGKKGGFLGDSLSASLAPNVAAPVLNLDADTDKVLEAAVAMCDMLRHLMLSFGSGLTAAVTCDSAFAGVMGSTRPTLDLLGNATRSTRSVVEAASPGFVCFLTGIVRLLEAGGKCPPSYPGDIELGPSQPWALRGHGLARVRQATLTNSPHLSSYNNTRTSTSPLPAATIAEWTPYSVAQSPQVPPPQGRR